NPYGLGAPPAEVAELQGYGPISPDVARALALGGTWQRLLVDPDSGAVLDVGRRRYRPPAELATFVRERDRTCVRPGCSTPAQNCDLDHTVPWNQGGPTAATNLTALCATDHAIKTMGAFQLRHRDDAGYEWITPAGHRYLRDADGIVQRLSPLGVKASEDDRPDPFPDEPPF
ncbi:MAG TPA: HNH endonuclease signature motif containing protein, partial [Actinomycetaceae bacterium]|nr:HNH endonuclease signature motif containing protein [Actinomycetaceae bacterium]